MIENFVPADTTLAVKAGLDESWLTVIGWSNTADGLRPVVVDRRTPCQPRVLIEPARYGDPSLSVTVGDALEVFANVSADQPLIVREH